VLGRVPAAGLASVRKTQRLRQPSAAIMGLDVLDDRHVGVGSGTREMAQNDAKLTVAQETMVSLNEIGLTRGERSTEQIFWSSVLGGAFISWGASMYLTLAGGSALALAGVPGIHKVCTAMIFPIGLSAIVVTGTDMLTSNMMYSTLPLVSQDSRRTTEQKLVSLTHLWSVSLVGNLVGCVGMAALTSHILGGVPEVVDFVQAMAVKKTSATATATFAKAVGCNWLVNLAIFQASTATTTPGKMAMLWLPVTTFVALGLEHFVANMYLLPLGAMLGADVSTSQIVINNLVPVFAGNVVGASFFVSFLQWKAVMTGVKQPFTKTF